MSPKIESMTKAATAMVGTPGEGAPRSRETGPDGSPPLPIDGGYEGLGIEGLAAMLVVDSANKMRDVMHTLEKNAKQAQVDALRQQVEALHDKADDMRAEGMLAGAFTIGGGLASIGNAVATVPGVDGAAKANVGGAIVRGLAPLGGTLSAFGPQLAKATYGAAQVNDDADATQHAADAKFAENAKDEYANLAKDARSTVDKAQQALQSFVQERTAAKRAILRI